MHTGAGPLANGRTDWYGIQDGKVVNEEYTKEKHGYSTGNGILASTTGNITRIYDMNGGAWERVAAYINSLSPLYMVLFISLTSYKRCAIKGCKKTGMSVEYLFLIIWTSQ